MGKLPQGVTLFNGRQSKVKQVQTKFGLVCLVEMTEYAQGESMQAISKRTGAVAVLIVGDGKLDACGVEEIEALYEYVRTLND